MGCLASADAVYLDLCNSVDELSEQEKTAELLPIGVQQLYVLCRLGKVEEAEKLASEIAIPEYASRSPPAYRTF